MELRFFQIDAFTSSRFSGNPAGVVLLETPLPDATMQSIAAENNLAETAFVHLGQHPLPLRWFTPTMEIDLCGHATLATAFVLMTEGSVRESRVEFQSLSGPLTVERSGDLYGLDFPSRAPEPIEMTEAIVEALGARPASLLASRDLLAVFETESEVAGLKPRFDQIEQLDTFAVIATAPGREVDFVSRFFAPKAGIPEDPVTGSAHCTLIPYWSKRLGRRELHARQISRRGGEIFCTDRGERVGIAGRAVEYLRGTISIDL